MKLSIGLILIVTICLVNSKEIKNKIKNFSNALSQVITNHYIKNSLDFKFIILSDKCENFASKVIFNVVKKIPEIQPYAVEVYKKAKDTNSKIKLQKSAIVFMNIQGDISYLNNRIEMTNSAFINFQHLIVIQNNTNIIKYPNNHKYINYNTFIMNYEVFMFHKKNEIFLQTVEWYSEKHCNQSIMKTINSFSNENQKWTTSHFGLIEYKQFYGCTLSFSVPKVKKDYFVYLLKQIETKLKFKFVIN